MDGLNERIVSYLKNDGRASYTDIADALNVSEGTIRNRVHQMQDDGTIKRFTVELSETEALSALVMITVDPHTDIGRIIEAFPQQTEILEVTGEWDMVVRLSRSTSEQLNDALEEIRKVDGVRQTKTHTVLKSRRR